MKTVDELAEIYFNAFIRALGPLVQEEEKVEDFKKDQKVRLRSEQYSKTPPRTILHVDGNVAMVKDHYGYSKLIKLTDLVSAEPVKIEPFQPGWYCKGFPSPLNPRVHNYYCYELNGKIMYTNSYNPVTGEMDATWVAGLLYPRELAGVTARDLTRLKMVPA